MKLWNVSHGDSYDHSEIGYVVAESEEEALFEGRKLACEEMCHATVDDLDRIVYSLHVSEVTVRSHSLTLTPNGDSSGIVLSPLVLECLKAGNTAIFEPDFRDCEDCLCYLCVNKCARNRCSYCHDAKPNAIISCMDDGKDILAIEEDER